MIVRSRIKDYADVIVVYIAVILIVSLAPLVLSATGNAVYRMLLRYGLYILMAAVVLCACAVKKLPIFSTLGFTKGSLLKQLLSAVPAFLVTASVFVVIPLLFGVPKTMLLDRKYTDTAEIVLRVIQYMVFVGFVEEIIFRGYLFERLRALTNSGIWTVVLTAVAFGLWHFPGSLDFLQVLMTSIIGFVFGLARLKLKNCTTLSVSLAHGLHDTFIMAMGCLLLT